MDGHDDTGGPGRESPRSEEERPRPQVREREKRERDLTESLGAAERRRMRKVRARESREESVWFGLGTFGLVGWSVAIPTLIGLALGIWLDSALPLGFSWTLTLLFAGIVVGCLNAWYWISRERDEIAEIRRDTDEEDDAVRTDREDEDGD